MTFPNLQEWFELIKEHYEEPIVTCEACKKQFSNNRNASLDVNGKRYYACSGQCKGKVSEIARRRNQNENKKKVVIDAIERNDRVKVTATQDVRVNGLAEMLQIWIESQNGLKRYEANILRIIRDIVPPLNN